MNITITNSFGMTHTHAAEIVEHILIVIRHLHYINHLFTLY